MTGRHGSPRERFWRHVNRPEDGHACWLWTGMLDRGYGKFRATLGSRGMVTAYSFAYELLIGTVPDGYELDHRCHSEAFERGECDGGDECPHRRCVNPFHLDVVTHAENMRRGAARRRDTCASGHGREHAYVRSSGQIAYCKICQRQRAAEYRARCRAARAPV